MNKLIKDGKVAVLYSPGYGAGWYTWGDEPEMIFDMTIASMVLNGNTADEIKAVAQLKWPDAFLGGADDLTVMWIDQGSLFRITEYDGDETVEVRDKLDWMIA